MSFWIELHCDAGASTESCLTNRGENLKVRVWTKEAIASAMREPLEHGGSSVPVQPE
jgi:hypothetical protein